MKRVYVCTNLRQYGGQASCAGRGSVALIDLLEAGIEERNLDYEVKTSVCLGHCEKGPNIKLPGEPILHHCDGDSVRSLLVLLSKNL